MKRCSVFILITLSFLCNGQEDYPTCVVPDTTIINQLRARVSLLEMRVSANLTERIAAVESKCQNNSLELRVLLEENNRLSSKIDTMEATIQELIINQTAALNRVERGRFIGPQIGRGQINSTSGARMLNDPQWYTAFNGFQYRVTENAQHWQRSRAVCRSLGGELAHIGIQDNGIRMQIAEELELEQTWIGLSDIDREGSFVWLDGTRASNENTDWFQGEPSNSNGNQDCAEIWGRNFNYRLNDDFCNKGQQALCERQLI